MKKIYTLLLALLSTATIHAQDEVLTFDNLLAEPDTFLNGSDGSGGFVSELLWKLPNDYNTEFMSWTGWAVSTMTDVETPGFDNQYSAIAGGGVDSSLAYAVSYHFIPNEIIMNPMIADAAPIIQGAYITNGTYPYLSMRDGDGFAKKFGGASGDDPDFFLLTIKGYGFDQQLTDSVEFYLADYRFEDNSQDYIVDDWTWVDMSSLGLVQRVEFVLSSSDVGMFGVNTPTYFCMDNLTADIFTSTTDIVEGQLSVYPNPTTDVLTVEHPATASSIDIFDASGRLLQSQAANGELTTVQLAAFKPGNYVVMVQSAEGVMVQRFVRM